jgi:DNA polymerase-4
VVSQRVDLRPPLRILHLDLDAFFAAVEVLDEPALAGRPVVVGGSGPRAVVASCSYEARRFGVRSAMPMLEALRRCPEATHRPLRMARYQEVGRALLELLRAAADVVEPVGLDEAYLDVGGRPRPDLDVEAFAEGLRRQVAAELGLSAAVGVAAHKHVAKLASRAVKRLPPAARGDRGILVVPPEAEAAFLDPLLLADVPGVGPVTAARLAALGLHQVADLRAVPRALLRRRLGRAAGDRLFAFAHGLLDEPVRASRPRQSISKVVTFPSDVQDPERLRQVVAVLAQALGQQLADDGLLARSVSVGLRDPTRRDHRRMSSSDVVGGPWSVGRQALALLERLPELPAVRAVEVSVQGLRPEDEAVQHATLPFACSEGSDHRGSAPSHRRTPAGLDAVASRLRARFGPAALQPASTLPGTRTRGLPGGVVGSLGLRED